MAEMIGGWLASLPDWLFLPALIVFVVAAGLGWWLYYSAWASIGTEAEIGLRQRKKHGKK